MERKKTHCYLLTCSVFKMSQILLTMRSALHLHFFRQKKCWVVETVELSWGWHTPEESGWLSGALFSHLENEPSIPYSSVLECFEQQVRKDMSYAMASAGCTLLWVLWSWAHWLSLLSSRFLIHKTRLW